MFHRYWSWIPKKSFCQEKKSPSLVKTEHRTLKEMEDLKWYIQTKDKNPLRPRTRTPYYLKGTWKILRTPTNPIESVTKDVVQEIITRRIVWWMDTKLDKFDFLEYQWWHVSSWLFLRTVEQMKVCFVFLVWHSKTCANLWLKVH